MGHNLRWDSLTDYTKRDANLYARCFICNRSAIFSSHSLAAYFRERGWHLGMSVVYRKLKCRKCRNPVGKVGPSRELPTVAPPGRRLR